MIMYTLESSLSEPSPSNYSRFQKFRCRNPLLGIEVRYRCAREGECDVSTSDVGRLALGQDQAVSAREGRLAKWGTPSRGNHVGPARRGKGMRLVLVADAV